jgi:hypothetical protein
MTTAKDLPRAGRSCRLVDMGPGQRALVLTFATPRTLKQVRYHLTRLDCEDVAFEVRKFSCDLGPDESGEPYAVNLTDGTCECRAALRWGHLKPCRHLSSLRALRERGSI